MEMMIGVHTTILPQFGRGGTPEWRQIKALFPHLARNRVPCAVPADLGFLRYAAMQAGAAIDCAYPLPEYTPTEGAYALTDCEEVLP
jgi:hypothetical protein